jgi:hypothetical protein
MSGAYVGSFKVLTTLTSQRIVTMVSGTGNTVQYPEDARRMYLGITLDDVEDTTSAIPVQLNGIADLYFNDTCTTGGLVGADTSGRGIPFAPAATSTGLTLGTGVIGMLVGPSVAATGTVAAVSINPFLAR